MPEPLKKVGRFLWREKKWWIIPFVLTMLILAAVVYFAQSSEPLSPYMYTH